jgi:hypothetical protein
LQSRDFQQNASASDQNLLKEPRASPVVQKEDCDSPQLLQKKVSGKTKGLKR